MCDLHKAEADYECKGFSIQSKKKKKLVGNIKAVTIYC